MDTIRAFKIWYSDKTVTSLELDKSDVFSAWKLAQKGDIQFVVFYFADNDGLGRPTRRICHGVDYYALTSNGKITQSFDDPNAVEGEIKDGKWTTDEIHERQHTEAYDDYGEGWLWSKPAEPPRSQKSIEQDI